MQYYGINDAGNTVYVAMSEKEVINYAKKHPEEGIIRVEDKFKHGYNLKESYIITESLKKWDKKEFEDNSNSYELEMLYESVKDTLSAQQKNDLVKFVRKARTADEINTYMTGMLVKDQMNEDIEEHEEYDGADGHSWLVKHIYSDGKIAAMKVGDHAADKDGPTKIFSKDEFHDFFNEGLKIQAYGKTKRIPKSLSNYMHTGKGREMDARFLEAAIEDTMYDDDGNYLGILDADKICRELNADKDFLYTVKPFKSTENNVRIIATDYNGNEDIISISKEANESLSEDYEQNLEKLKDLAYKLEVALNDVDVWIDDVWYDGDSRTITVFVTNGDWKHDHWRLDNFLRDWIEKNNLDADVRTNDLESDSDVYDAYHIIKFRNLFNEGYISQSSPQKHVEEPEKFSNGTLRDFDPYTFVKNIMRSGKSMNSIRTLGDDYYTIFVSYMNLFGPRGIDDKDTKYSLDIIKETPDGGQARDLSERDLLWNEVAEKLIDWRQDKVTENPLAESIAQLSEGYSYRKVEKAILQAISDIGGECFETIDNDSCSYRFEGKVSRKALITNLSDALKSTGYTILSDNSGVEVQDNDNWWQGTNIEIYNDPDNQEKGYSFFIIGIYDLS